MGTWSLIVRGILRKENKLVIYVRESMGELKKVIWSRKEDVINSTVVVVIFIIIMSLFLGLFDLGVGEFVRYLFR